MNGVDPVSKYNGEMLSGKCQFHYSIGDMLYLFANPENLAQFEDNPSLYLGMRGKMTSDELIGQVYRIHGSKQSAA